MNKKELMNRGLSEEHADIVLEMIKDSFVPLYRFNEINDKMKSYKTQLEEKTEEVNTLSAKVKDTEKLDAEIKTLKEANAKAIGDHQAEMASMKKSNAVDARLRERKAKNIKAVKALLDMNKITFENDELDGLDDQLDYLEKGEDSKFMFESTTEYAPKGTTPGEATGGTTGGTVSFADAIKNALNFNK